MSQPSSAVTAGGAEWRKLAARILVPMRFVDRDWLPGAARQCRSILHEASRYPAAAKVLRRFLPNDLDTAAIQRDALETGPSWASWPAAAQRHLVRRLGTIACAPYLRLVVSKSELDTIRRSIDPDIHREALAMRDVLVHTDIRAEFDDAMNADRLASFVAAVGIAVLRQTIPDRQRFLLFRLKYLFPQLAWRVSLPELTCNGEFTIALLEAGDDSA